MKICLIGMMGSGKTSLGKKIAEKTGMSYHCTDEYIERNQNMTISDIFSNYGEEYFRKLEAEAVNILSRNENTVLSTGGGVILNERNIQKLKERKFTIVFLNRDINIIEKNINTESRPLIKENPGILKEIFSVRKSLYEKYSDICYENNNGIDFDAEKLIKLVINTTEKK